MDDPADDLIAWLLGPGRALPTLEVLVDALCEKLVAAGLPLDRASISTRTLHSVHLSYSRIWYANGTSYSDTFDRDEESLGYFERSPYRTIFETGEWLVLWIPDTPDELYGIIPDLREQGIVHYICMPVTFSDGVVNMLSWATRNPAGFSNSQVEMLHAIAPTLSATLEIRMLRRAMVDALQIYLGDTPGRLVADGAIVRGAVSEIDCAILFADLRGFTAASVELDSPILVRLLNEYFACLVPAIDAQRGDVLKLMGDGLLAIFADAEGDAAGRALTAAREAQAAIAEANQRGSDWPALVAGIALHHGTVAYGNIGAPGRLDFTVIGRDVNLASRICGVCREAQAPILISPKFCDRLGESATEVGSYMLAGFWEPITLYAPG